MADIISHIVAGRMLGVSIEKLDYAVLAYEELLEISKKAYETLLSESPDATVALASEGSEFLKSALICQCIIVLFNSIPDKSKSDLVITACASTTNSYFLSLVEIDENDNSPQQQANLLLLALINKLAASVDS